MDWRSRIAAKPMEHNSSEMEIYNTELSDSDSSTHSTINLNGDNSIEAPEELEHDEIPYQDINLDTTNVFRFVAPYMSPKDLQNLRFVSKGIDQMLSASTKIKDGIRFHINGNAFDFGSDNGTFPPEQIKVLTESKFGWANVKFSNVDLEQYFFCDSFLFDKFVKGTCLDYLKSLTFSNVYCSLGRLIELVTFCRHLEELKIIDCPCFFHFGMELLNWSKFIPYFRQRLATLKHLTLIDRSSEPTRSQILNLANVQGLMSTAQRLVTLEINLAFGTIPINYLMSVIAKNSKTLRNLALVGNCGFDEECWKILSSLSLKSLHFGKITVLDTTNLKLAYFLGTQSSMESICFSNFIFHRSCFTSFGRLSQLKELIFQDVVVIGGLYSNQNILLGPMRNLKKLKTLRFLDTTPNSNPVMWIPIFDAFNTVPPALQLHTLHLRFNRALVLTCRLPKAFTESLKVLIISDVGKFSEQPQNSIIQMTNKLLSIKSLETLEFINSTVADQHFPAPPALPPPSLIFNKISNIREFSNLKILNLSHTQIGDKVLINRIIHLPSLEMLYMNQTQITRLGVWRFGKWKKHKRCLRKLKIFSALNCKQLVVSFQRYMAINDLLECEFACDYYVENVINILHQEEPNSNSSSSNSDDAPPSAENDSYFSYKIIL